MCFPGDLIGTCFEVFPGGIRGVWRCLCLLGCLFAFGLFVKWSRLCAVFNPPNPLERSQQNLAGLSTSLGEFFWLFYVTGKDK